MEFSGNNLVTGFHDGIAFLFIQHMGRHIRVSRCFFDSCQVFDNLRVKGSSCDLEIIFRTERLHSIVGFLWYIHGSDGIGFSSCHHNLVLPFSVSKLRIALWKRKINTLKNYDNS